MTEGPMPQPNLLKKYVALQVMQFDPTRVKSAFIDFLQNYPARYLQSCRFITVVRAHLKVPAKNPPALLFLSRGKAADCFYFSFFFFSPAEEEQGRGILGGNFQTHARDCNKAAGL